MPKYLVSDSPAKIQKYFIDVYRALPIAEIPLHFLTVLLVRGKPDIKELEHLAEKIEIFYLDSTHLKQIKFT